MTKIFVFGYTARLKAKGDNVIITIPFLSHQSAIEVKERILRENKLE